MTVSRPCYFGNLLLGVVGVDVNLAYILEDVTYYQDSLASYTFLIDNKGQSEREMLLHPRSSDSDVNTEIEATPVSSRRVKSRSPNCKERV